MSGPYPPSGNPQQPDQGGWPGSRPGSQPYGPAQGGPGGQTGQYGQPGIGQFGQYGGGQTGQTGQTGQYGTPAYGFPTVQYSGLSGQPGGWGEPPRKKRSVGRIVVVVVSVLVIVGGVATGFVLLQQRGRPAAASGTTTAAPPTTASGVPGGSGHSAAPSSHAADPGVPNGRTSLSLAKGACVTAQAGVNNQYSVGRRTTCGAPDSDLVLAQVAGDLNGCADHQYLRVQGASSVYCFTLDVRIGDCIDGSYLKVGCAGAPFIVLKTEPGPGGASSCGDTSGATHWVPVGHDPVVVGCIGPAKGP